MAGDLPQLSVTIYNGVLQMEKVVGVQALLMVLAVFRIMAQIMGISVGIRVVDIMSLVALMGRMRLLHLVVSGALVG